MNRPTRAKLYERRREVANYALKGWTQAAIARHMHIPPATVSRDLAAMREFWREFSVYDFDSPAGLVVRLKSSATVADPRAGLTLLPPPASLLPHRSAASVAPDC